MLLLHWEVSHSSSAFLLALLSGEDLKSHCLEVEFKSRCGSIGLEFIIRLFRNHFGNNPLSSSPASSLSQCFWKMRTSLFTRRYFTQAIGITITCNTSKSLRCWALFYPTANIEFPQLGSFLLFTHFLNVTAGLTTHTESAHVMTFTSNKKCTLHAKVCRKSLTAYHIV